MSLRTCKQCGYESDNLEEFQVHNESQYGRRNLCISCANERRRAKNAKKRELINDLKRKPCAICGKSFPPCAMDFHHVGEEDKEFKVADFAQYKLEDILVEVNKCMLLCACCHRILHSEES